MTTKTTTRRRQPRFAVAPTSGAWVEFEYPPGSGQQHRLPLLDVSASGVSFSLEDEPLSLEMGANLAGVEIEIGGCLIRGDLVVMHLTPAGGDGASCGALFYPEDDADLLKLKSVVAGMQAVQPA